MAARDDQENKQKPRVITPGLLTLNQWVLGFTVCQTIFIIGSARF
jgi:hypothetical protein